MSTPDGEPMFPADYDSVMRDAHRHFDAMSVAGDREAMKEALTEFIVRLMFEHGDKWAGPFSELLWDAEQDAKKEFNEAPINRGKVHV